MYQAHLPRPNISVPSMAMRTCSAEEGESTSKFDAVKASLSQQSSIRWCLRQSTPIIDTSADQVIGTRSRSASCVNKKGVCIDERVQVRTTIACHEMSQQEIDTVWYSPDEFHQITESCCKQIVKLNRGETLKDKKYCARGLESHTAIRSLAKSMNRDLVHQVVVFDEQERQRQTGIHNDEALSQVYLAASHGSCLWANVIGLDDQKEAENICDETL